MMIMYVRAGGFHRASKSMFSALQVELSAQGLFNEMLLTRLEPEQRAYAMLLSAYGNGTQRTAALKLFYRMPRSFQPISQLRFG